MSLSILMMTYEVPGSLREPAVSGEVKNPYHLIRGLDAAGHQIEIINVPFLSKSVSEPGWRTDADLPTYDIPEGRTAAVVRTMDRIRGLQAALEEKDLSKYDVIHAEATALGVAALRVRRIQRASTPIVTTGHGTNLPEAEADGKFSLRQRARIANAHINLHIDRVAFQRSNACISVSTFQCEELEQIYGVPRERIEVIRNGIDLTMYNPDGPTTENQDLPTDGPRFLFVGRLVPKKGLQYLIDAFPAILERFPTAHCVVVGGSPIFDFYGDELRRHAETTGVSHAFHWLSETPESELPGYYRSASICVFPSENYESLPTVALEGMACGVPVVTTRRWGTPEAMGHEHAGLIEPASPEEIVEASTALLTDQALREHTVADQLERIKAFDLRLAVNAHEELYRRV